MIRFKREQYFLQFINYFSDLTSITYEDIIDFATSNKLSYGIVSFNEEKDTLYLNTNDSECYIETNGDAIKCRGKYATLQKEGDYESMNNELNNDLEDIVRGNKDIICINNPFFEEV